LSAITYYLLLQTNGLFLKRFLKILRRTILGLIAFLLIVFLAIQTSVVQNWLVGIAAKRFSKTLGTEVSIKKVSISLFNRLNMDTMLVRDQHRDTILYAGQLKVRITDWFFLKDSAILKYVGLEDAVVKLQRNDSNWNYQFIIDSLASPSSPKKKEGGGLALNLKKVDLKNVRFIKNDRWRGERMEIGVGSLLLDADKIDFNKSIFQVNDVSIDKPFFSILNLPALRPDSLKPRAPATPDTGMYLNAGNMLLKVNNLRLSNGNLLIDSDTKTPYAGFDGSHIHLSKLNGTFNNISFVKDTLRANIDLSVKDRSGFELKKLKALFRFTPQIMELASLDLQTNKSRLGNYYAMKFTDFNEDFSEYITKVVMEARFYDSKVNTDDIAYFAPELKTWNKVAQLSGHFHGTVSNFNIASLVTRLGATTTLSGNLSMKGLPDINTTRINWSNGTLLSNQYDLATFLPILKSVTEPNLAALGTIIYRGNFNGTIHNFTTDGILSSQLGGVKTNISLQLPRIGEPSYTGNIETNRFNIGKFLNNDNLGLADFKGKITGSSFNIDKVKTTLDGNISSLEFNNYTYSNIITNGTFQKKYFSGEVKINDPNLNFTSNVEIDLTREQPSFNILGDLVNSNLYELHFMKENMELTGLLDVNFSGTNIDNFLGTAKFLNANIKSQDTKLSFDSVNLSSYYRDSTKYLQLNSNDFAASIYGKFSILDLPASFQVFLNHYFPTYVTQPRYTPRNQQFNISLRTNYIEPYLRVFNKHLSGFNDASLEGSVDTRKNELHITSLVPFGKYDNYTVTGIDLKGVGNMDTLSLKGEISSIQAGDSLRFPNTHLNIVSKADHSVVSVKTSADNTLNDASLNADVFTLSDGVRVQFRPSSFVLNEKKWNIEKEGELVVRSHFVNARNVKFVQGFQEISVKTEEEDGGNTDKLVVALKNVVMGDLTSLFMKKPHLEGVTNGNVVLSDFFGQFKADAALKTEQFRMDDDSIGTVSIKAGYDSKTGKISMEGISPNDGYNFSFAGLYNLKDSVDQPLNIDLKLKDSKIDILHNFLSDLFTDIKGKATGNLSITGTPNSPNLQGRVRLKNAGMKVNYTQVYYTIDSADIRFEEDGINFGEFKIRDVYKNTGTIKGKLYEHGFKDLTFDFEMNTNKLLLIDTRPKDNQQFYGKAIGSVSLSLRGHESAARMTIIGESTDSSHIYIPNSVSKESGTADFIVFRQYGTEMAKAEKSSNFNLLVDLDITANNKTQIDVIMDELAGDVIKATGNGRLKIRAGTSEPLTIRGRYNIEKGNYDFNMQGLVRKPFELLPDAGNYIEWNGDPFKANIYIDAQYTAQRVSLSDLIGTNNFTGTIKAYRGDVYVIVQLRDQLLKPAISFRFDFPAGSPAKTDNDFSSYMSRIEKDQNEMLKQVAFLIAFNSFSPVGETAGSNTANPYSLTTVGVNTLSQVLTKEVNKVFSNILYKLTGDKSLRFDLGTSLYSSSSLDLNTDGVVANSNRLDRSRINFKFGKSFFNDKVVVTFGGDLDFNLGNTSAVQNGNFQWLPDLNIEIVLSRDRKVRMIIFSKNSLDIAGSSLGRRNRQGASISYRRDFETLFGRKEKDIEFKAPLPDSTAFSDRE